MNPRQTASLAFKLAGLFAFIQGIRLLPDALSILATDLTWPDGPSINVPLAVFAQVFPVGLLFILGVFLIIGSGRLAASSFPRSGAEDVGLRFGDLHRYCFR